MVLRAPGPMLAVTIAALLFLFLLHRTLDRLRLGKSKAMFVLLAMLVGGFIPSLPLGGGLAINIGGMAIPLGICVYLIAGAPTRQEQFRGPLTALVVFFLIWGVDRFLPTVPSTLYELDPIYIPAAVAGITAYILGRSRRSSFIGAVLGIFLLDVGSWAENMIRGFRDIPVILGGAGVFDATVLAGVIAVMLAELIGEVRERLANGPEGGQDH